MRRFGLGIVLGVIAGCLVSCVTEQTSGTALDEPAAYIPPPTDTPPPPASGSDQWIGPEGYGGESR